MHKSLLMKSEFGGSLLTRIPGIYLTHTNRSFVSLYRENTSWFVYIGLQFYYVLNVNLIAFRILKGGTGLWHHSFTLCPHHRDQSAYVLQRNSWVFWELYETHKYTVLQYTVSHCRSRWYMLYSPCFYTRPLSTECAMDLVAYTDWDKDCRKCMVINRALVGHISFVLQCRSKHCPATYRHIFYCAHSRGQI